MSEQNTLFDEALSVGQLYRKSKNALAREFRGPVWVLGEIKNYREMRGSLYLTLVEPGSYNDGGDITLDVAAWPRKNALLQRQLQQAGVKLSNGMVVRIQGTVTISKIGRLQVELHALDTEALVGRQAAEKRRLYQALEAEGLLTANKALPVPVVPLRVGLVASEGSEGFNDFMGQLERSGFAFEVSFAHSPVQGPAAPGSLARAITALGIEALDVIAVVRGGGGELDAFDKEPVARAIATSAIPVWTGIGHTGDRAVADDVAQQSFITPTECGQGLVRAVGAFAQRLDHDVQRLHRLTERVVDGQSTRVRNLGRHLARGVTHRLDQSEAALHRHGERARRTADRDLALASAGLEGLRRDLLRGSAIVPQEATRTVARLSRGLAAAASRRQTTIEQEARLWGVRVSSFDPRQQLRRGYSLTRTIDGQVIRDVATLRPGEQLITSFATGEARSTVDTIETSQEQS